MHMYQARVQLTERAKRPPAALRLPLQLNPLGDSGGGGGGGGGGGSGGGEGGGGGGGGGGGEMEARAAAAAAAAEVRAADLATELSLVRAQLAEGAELLIETARSPMRMHTVCTCAYETCTRSAWACASAHVVSLSLCTCGAMQCMCVRKRAY